MSRRGLPILSLQICKLGDHTMPSSIHELKVGTRVASTIDSIGGTVTGVDYASIAVLWDDGVSSQFRKADGFVAFNIEPAKPEAGGMHDWDQDLQAQEKARCKFCGDIRPPLDQFGHCTVCVNGMARTNGD